MKRKSNRFAIPLVITLALFALAAKASALDAGSWGSKGASADSQLTVEDMLRYAIEDEYTARAEYYAIIERFGSARPFTNIVRSEETHVSWLVDAYAAAGLPLPHDEARAMVTVPSSLATAYQIGVDAEIANIAMYDSFLDSPLLKQPENASLVALFTRLRDASKNHLSAFQRALGRS